jgi:hypothetical protein
MLVKVTLVEGGDWWVNPDFVEIVHEIPGALSGTRLHMHCDVWIDVVGCRDDIAKLLNMRDLPVQNEE